MHNSDCAMVTESPKLYMHKMVVCFIYLGEKDRPISPVCVTIAGFYRTVNTRVTTPHRFAPQIFAESAVRSMAIRAWRLFKPACYGAFGSYNVGYNIQESGQLQPRYT